MWIYNILALNSRHWSLPGYANLWNTSPDPKLSLPEMFDKKVKLFP
jgi:hypothetical protein